ncbi:MAG TPA: PAS domain-containing protein [Candidatus Methylomirabilis sp.]|nr:PAS domain-containing protein [Candidatus Methylomirabilis sp.]
MLSAPGDVAYRYNFLTNRFDYVSPEISALLGYSEAEWLVMDMREAFERLHPNDCLKVGDGLKAIIRGGRTILEYRFLGKDGAYHWLNDRMEIITDTDERPRYRVGVLREHVGSADVVEAATDEVSAEKRRLIARWLEDARSNTAKPGRGVRGSRAAAMAAGVLLLLGGTFAYYTMRGITPSQGPTSQGQVAPGSETGLAEQLRSLTAEKDRLERRVRALERRLAAARDGSGTKVHPVVAATPRPRTGPAPGEPQPMVSATRTRHVWALFRVPAHQPIAPDPPTSR